ncbi:MAG: zinc-ribbon domain-containing protein [Candidatus Methanomethylophilaceae archaeon]|nr:zinc-ribbon domain-containing protein [Candidatus Methanomethylophilaceae archaeon]
MGLESLSRAVSVVWLAILVLRLVLTAVPYMSTPEGKTFMTVVNVVLIGGLVLIGAILGRRLFRYAAAKADKEGHCQQCYAKVDPGAQFCPVCGKKI